MWRERLGWSCNGIGSQSDISYLLQVATLCRNFDLAVQTKKKLLDSAKTSSRVLKACYYYGLARAFYLGLIAYWQFKKCPKISIVKRQRLLKEAKHYHELIRDWVVVQGSINLPQKLFILDAEELSLSIKSGGTGIKREEARAKLKAAYDKAIVASIRSGFSQDAALAAQLASEALPAQRDAYWERARSCYLQWGAVSVVKYIEEQRQEDSSHHDSEEGLTEGKMEKGFRARTRFSEVVVFPRADSNRALPTGDPKVIRLPQS